MWRTVRKRYREPTLDRPPPDGLAWRCLMSNPDTTLFAKTGSVFMGLPFAWGPVALLVLYLFATSCEISLDRRERDDKTQEQRMDQKSQRAVGSR